MDHSAVSRESRRENKFVRARLLQMQNENKLHHPVQCFVVYVWLCFCVSHCVTVTRLELKVLCFVENGVLLQEQLLIEVLPDLDQRYTVS